MLSSCARCAGVVDDSKAPFLLSMCALCYALYRQTFKPCDARGNLLKVVVSSPSGA